MNNLRMGILTIFLALIFSFVGIFIPHQSNQSIAKKNKVPICHIPPDNPANYKEINVSENAIPDHLSHGDCPGPCVDSDADGIPDCNDLCPNRIVDPGEQCDPPGGACDSDQDGNDDSTCDDQCKCPTTPGVTGSGLRVDILDATIPPDRRPRVTIKLTDDKGNPLTTEGVRIRLLIAFIGTGESQYTDYITNEEGQPAAEDSTEGTLQPLGDGVYEYTFHTVLPEDYQMDVTHTIGIYADRQATINNVAQTFVANSTFNFVPSGGPVTVVRDVVRTDACNYCHDPLALHHGFRRAVPLCVLCHTPQNADPDTGNTLDFNVMIHKIHRGAQLPSVEENGIPYVIAAHDFSNVEFPQDIRNCTECHTSEATQSDAFKIHPSRAACGSCHDDVDFATVPSPGRTAHAGGPQLDDGNCSVCHIPDSGVQFDLSVTGSHTNPLRADTLPGVNFEIAGVRSAETGSTTVAPGEHAEVTYSIKTDAGEVIDPKDMDSISLVISGPTTDYNIQEYHGNVPPVPGEDNFLLESPAQDSVGPDASGNFTYTFSGMIPPNGTGTYAVGIEGRIARTVGGNNLILQEEVEEAGQNVVFYFPVTDPVAVPRRIVVDNTTEDQFCNACHGTFSKDFSIHGNLRNNTEYCVLCHNSSNDDIEVRPADAAMPTASINFRVMIHKIHTGENLTVKPYIIYGFGGSVHDFSDLLYPGKTQVCGECHLPGTNLLDPGRGILGPDILETIVRDFTKTDDTLDSWTNFFTTPVTSTCTACHDDLGVNAAGDALTGVNHPGGPQPESACIICHVVEVVHLPALPPDQRINRPQ